MLILRKIMLFGSKFIEPKFFPSVNGCFSPRISQFFLKFVLLTVFHLTAGGCQGPSFIDKECIKGRLSAEQAEEINQGPWGHLPTYNRDEENHCKDCAAAEDRVLAAKCSDFLKKVTLHE
jgi:hypothetical protein